MIRKFLWKWLNRLWSFLIIGLIAGGCYYNGKGASLSRLHRALVKADIVEFGRTLPGSLMSQEDLVMHLYVSQYSAEYTFDIDPVRGGWAVNNMRDGVVPVYRVNGLIYVISHKWVNQSAGLAYVLDPAVTSHLSEEVRGLHYEEIRAGVYSWRFNAEE